MNILEYLSSTKASFHHKCDGTDECACAYAISDEVMFSLLNKFLKDKILHLFLDDVSMFGKNLNLSEFYFYFDDLSKDIINLNLPNEVKTLIRKALKKDSLNIKIDLL